MAEMYKSLVIFLAFISELFQWSYEATPDYDKCQNNYDGVNQLFFMNGRRLDNQAGPHAKVGYIITHGVGAHKLYPKKIKWNAARQACLNDGGHLAVVNSLAEERVLVNLLQSANFVEAWVGIHDQFEEGDWITLSGESLERAGYDKWSNLWPNEPDNLNGNQNCGTLRKEAAYDDVDCNLHHPYICEIEMF
ncbi:hemolymph lipopolysaccharide-binding protein-like [Nomia melanderi]|uniref:hemolymph lipopolysaccharide-binding protein-like n=1 Tax=Nomia melanderi TaxID=2448451 RepID=UPI003FCC2B56